MIRTGFYDRNNVEVCAGDVVCNKTSGATGIVFYNPLYARFMIRDIEKMMEKCDCSFDMVDDVEILQHVALEDNVEKPMAYVIYLQGKIYKIFTTEAEFNSMIQSSPKMDRFD